ncbi:MAG: organic solvent tolerance protein OstA [Bacteroidia bacterium]|nr:organic solvent tolerance protein OstA [Bacteroidia bacterium]
MKLIIEYFSVSHLRWIIFLGLSLFTLTTFSQKTTQVQILSTDSMVFDKRVNDDLRKLIGHVVFRHNNDLMYCDSAFFFKSRNSLEAFSRVHLIHNDSVNLYGDYLKYNGDIRFGQVRKNVRMIDKYMTLTTQNLDFDLENNVSNYFSGGEIVDTANILVSRNGYYFSDTNEFFFKDDVVLINRDYTIYCDTLKYNSKTKVATFLGPTTIVSDSNLIYCENGWYDTNRNISQFNKNAYLKNTKQTLKGDSIYYDRKLGMGKAFENVMLTDTSEKIILKGDEAYYLEKNQLSFMTGHAMFITYSDSDSLFLHADTIKSMLDTSGKYKHIFAYRKVKFYRFDLQGKCDSLFYSLKDSVIRLYGRPVLWSDQNQLTADFIQLHTIHNKADRIELKNAAFIASRDDSIRFNQISGKTMTGFIKHNKLFRINVNGNGQTLYYARDNNQLIGLNKAESSDLIIYLKESKVDKINFITQPGAIMNPPHQVKKEDTLLKGFQWFEPFRPKNKRDIFTWSN